MPLPARRIAHTSRMTHQHRHEHANGKTPPPRPSQRPRRDDRRDGKRDAGCLPPTRHRNAERPDDCLLPAPRHDDTGREAGRETTALTTAYPRPTIQDGETIRGYGNEDTEDTKHTNIWEYREYKAKDGTRPDMIACLVFACVRSRLLLCASCRVFLSALPVSLRRGWRRLATWCRLVREYSDETMRDDGAEEVSFFRCPMFSIFLSFLFHRPTPSCGFFLVCLLELFPRPRAWDEPAGGRSAAAGVAMVCLLPLVPCRSLTAFARYCGSVCGRDGAACFVPCGLFRLLDCPCSSVACFF